MIRRRPEPLDDGLPFSKLRSRPVCDEPDEVRSPRHLAHVRSKPCCVPGCGRRPVQAHHRIAGRNRMGKRASDAEAVPLCIWHHDAKSPDGVHHWGDEAKWEERYGVRLGPVAYVLACESVKAGRLKPEDVKEAA